MRPLQALDVKHGTLNGTFKFARVYVELVSAASLFFHLSPAFGANGAAKHGAGGR